MNATNQGQLDSYISQLAALQGKYDEQKLDMSNLDNQRVSAEQNYQGALNEKLRLESELIEARNQLKQTPQSMYNQQRVQDLQEALSANQMNMNQLQNSLTEMQSGLASKDNEINTYKSYIDRLTGERDSIQSVLSQTQTRVNALQQAESVANQKRLDKERSDREWDERQAEYARQRAAGELEEARKAAIASERIMHEMLSAGWTHTEGTNFKAEKPLIYGGRFYAPGSTYNR